MKANKLIASVVRVRNWLHALCAQGASVKIVPLCKWLGRLTNDSLFELNLQTGRGCWRDNMLAFFEVYTTYCIYLTQSLVKHTELHT